MGAGEKSERVVVAAAFFGGDIDGDGRTLTFEGKVCAGCDVRDGRSFEVWSDRREGNDVGAMGVALMRDAETVWSEDAGESAEGVGEFVGILETSLKELMLGVSWQGGNELQMKFFHGSGRFDGVEMEMKRTKKGIWRKSRLGKNEATSVSGPVIEGEGEVQFCRGALVMLETGAEGLQESFGHEEERFMTVDGWFKLMGDAVVVVGAVELEQAMVFPVGDVVESGEFFSESFGEALPGEEGQVLECLKSPELENGSVGKRESLRASEVGEMEGEGIALVEAKGGEVGEIRGEAEPDLEREGEIA